MLAQDNSTTRAASVNWISSAPTPHAEISHKCRCIIVRQADGAEIATIRETKRESPLIEAMATLLVNVATKEQYSDWRQYLDKLEALDREAQRRYETITRSESAQPRRER